MKFGVFDHMDDAGVPLGRQLADRLRLAQAYDRLGFYAYHVAEHHGTPLGMATSPGLFFANIATRTTTLRFGPLVYLLPFYHPIRLIEEICTLDHLSGGRYQLGVGRGVSPPETESFGLDFSKTQEMYHEAYQALIRGLTEDTLSFAGKHYRFENVPMLFKPVQKPHPPLWYGYSNPDNAPWPAANDVNVVMLGLAPRIRELVSRYREERGKAGKDPGAMPYMGVGRHVVVADTDADAMRIARPAYARWRDSFFLLWRKRGAEPRIAALYPETFDEMQAIGNGIAGTPDTVREFIAADIAATGVNYYLSWLAFGDLKVEDSLRSAELLAQEVMPAFAEK